METVQTNKESPNLQIIREILKAVAESYKGIAGQQKETVRIARENAGAQEETGCITG